MTKEQQITELNSTVKCALKPSPIHGIGVFALVDIQKGQKLNCHLSQKPHWYNIPWGSLNKLFPPIKELIIQRWASIVNGSHFLSPNDDTILILYMNHSSDNDNYDPHSDTALRDIKVGEEILEDYRSMLGWQKAFPWIQE